ncbi:sortase domain-containing protein [Actinomycetospora chiangmaiensis]|uniref:sortase domain-containing protein n=1 Tax=Actinomycetospora chiangmaiensis TaxID=402650 RepID=UPI00037F85BF|nr:sortase [Actinomycetospora chiangmaiensis]
MLRRRTAVAVLVTALLALVATACSSGSEDDQPLAASQQSTAGLVPGYSVSIPKLNETSQLIGLGLNADRSIQVPPLADPMQAGVYTKGPMPGQTGPAVVLAHINANGTPGFGEGFHTLAAGDEINVTTPSGPVSFAVTRTETAPKAEFPTAAVYSDTVGPELRLITCGGTLDRSAHNYLGQTIVYAKKV